MSTEDWIMILEFVIIFGSLAGVLVYFTVKICMDHLYELQNHQVETTNRVSLKEDWNKPLRRAC